VPALRKDRLPLRCFLLLATRDNSPVSALAISHDAGHSAFRLLACVASHLGA
jgi:hypothetical protein